MSDTGPEAGTTITVAGLGSAPIQPDRAEIGLGANASADTAAEARDTVAAAMTAILAAVRGLGVRTLRTSNLSVAPRYDHRGETTHIVGYEATNAVTATIEDLETLGAVVDAAIAAGATSLDGPRFFAADPSEAIATARRLAVEDAAGRATTLAEAAGLQVIGIVSISEGSDRPIPIPRAARMMALADAMPSPIEVGADEVRVEVEVVYRAG
ncbi:MAG: SIMPL domain-containing protein [Candidatus Limnocylindrales bacterium]